MSTGSVLVIILEVKKEEYRRKSELETVTENYDWFIDFLMDFGTILTSKNEDYFVTETSLDRSRSVSEPRVGHFDPILALRVENDAPLSVLGSQNGGKSRSKSIKSR